MTNPRKTSILDSYNAVMTKKSSVRSGFKGEVLKIDTNLFSTQVPKPITPLVKNIPVLMVKSTAN